MWKKLLIVAGVGITVALVAKKLRTASYDRAVWHEATIEPDLR
jgi:hypothetical protein